MTKIIMNETLRGLLPDLSRPVVFCDEEGHIIGHFLPETLTMVGQREPPPLSEEEIKRRIMEEPRYTTAEVLAYLESLP
jgi:hypothetical protein